MINKRKNVILKKLMEKRSFFLLLLVLFFLLLTFFIDNFILNYLIYIKNTLQENKFFNFLFLFCFFLQKEYIFYPLILFLTFFLLYFENGRQKKFNNQKLKSQKNTNYFKIILLIYIISLALSLFIAFLLKVSISRVRPDLSDSYSFPSGHATFLFVSIPLFKNKKLKVWWASLAFLFLLIRVSFMVHYLSDIIGGAILGYYVTTLLIFLKTKLFKLKK